MTKKVGATIMLEKEEPRPCSVCGVVRECRPYGPGGADICIVCVHKPQYIKEGITRTTERFKGITRVVKVVKQNG